MLRNDPNSNSTWRGGGYTSLYDVPLIRATLTISNYRILSPFSTETILGFHLICSQNCPFFVKSVLVFRTFLNPLKKILVDPYFGLWPFSHYFAIKKRSGPLQGQTKAKLLSYNKSFGINKVYWYILASTL